MELNKYQTAITEDLIKMYPQEVIDQLYDVINNIPFIKHLISADRKYARDLPRDEEGKIIVDISKPHILEDMDYFRPAALHFKEHGCYTMLRPNRNPNSEYMKWIMEERRRCWEGMVRPSDGEWVTGYMYWYLNYCPIMLSRRSANSNKANRVEDFPDVWEGIYWRFHYLDQARKNGHHAIELARRGAHPYNQDVLTPEGWKKWEEITIGSKLFSTYGTICTVTDIPFDDVADYYKVTLRDGREILASDDHIWKVVKGGKEHIKTTEWLFKHYISRRTPNERVPTGIEYQYAIPVNKGVNFEYKHTKIDPYTLGFLIGDGCFRHKSGLYFTQSEKDFNIIKCFIPYKYEQVNVVTYRLYIENWKEILKSDNLYMQKSEGKFIPDEYKFNTREVRLQVLRGILDADGHVAGGVPVLSTASEKLKDDVLFIARSLGYNCFWTKQKAGYKKEGKYIQCLDTYSIHIYGGQEVFNLPRKKELVEYPSPNAKSRRDRSKIINIEYIGKTKCKCVTVDSKDNCYLIGDFVTTHNCSKSYTLASMMSHNFVLGENEEARKRTTTVLTAYQNQYLSVGKDGTLSKFVPMIDFVAEHTQFPKLRLKDSPQEMVWQQGYKDKETGISKGSLNLVMGVSSKDDEGKLRGKRGYIFFEEMGSFPNLLSVYNTVRYGLEDGNAVFGLAYLVGTAAEDASDFSSAKEMLYNPEGYNIQGIPNVYDKLSQGKSSFGFFFPSYINRQGCYNEDGVSDVIKALLEILEKRYDAKYKTNDPKTIIRVIAEMPITPAEATIKVDANKFPVTTLTERLVQLDTDPNELNSIKVGRLEFGKDGKLTYIPTGEKPIRHFPTKDNKVHGAIEFFQMPEIDKATGEPFANRYILGHDPVDNDTAETMSLSSTFVLDLWTDRIVAEYTGRQDFADENFEICRRLCLFYNGKVNYENNKKGLFAYFSRMNSVYLMTDTLKFLRDQQQVKAPSYGNAAKGTPASQGINNYAIDLIRDWLLKPITVIRNIDGVDQEISIPNLYHIQSRALLQELISFNEVGNFDRVSSMGMLMLLRQDKIIKFQGNFESAKEAPKDPNYLGNDPFFNNNYDKRWGSKFP